MIKYTLLDKFILVNLLIWKGQCFPCTSTLIYEGLLYSLAHWLKKGVGNLFPESLLSAGKNHTEFPYKREVQVELFIKRLMNSQRTLKEYNKT